MYIKGRLAKQALDCIHPACFCLSAENVSPSRGTRGFGTGLQGFCQGFEAVVVEGVLVVCRGRVQGFVYCFAGRVQHIFILLANHGAYTFHFHTYLLKV